MRFRGDAYSKLYPRKEPEKVDVAVEDSMIQEPTEEPVEEDAIVVVKDEEEVKPDGNTGTGELNSE